ncbi:MAG: outer membrane lipoprotein-sorting protein [Bradymonadaceae bacterium]|nr:outer membrane lipoprotein-sorting protein [Lujinxingiaceae bacterium]
MKKHGWICAGALALMSVAAPLVAQEMPQPVVEKPVVERPVVEKPAEPALPTIKEIVDKLDNMYRSTSSHGTIEMTVVNARGTRKLTIEQWTMGEDKALMVIREPSREAGTATLKLEDGLWNYAPRADRLIRIPSGLLSDSWMGSHLSNDDLMRETSYESDHDTTLAWVHEGGARFLQATMVPKPTAPVVWDKIVYRMTADEWLPVEASFYDKGKVMRTMSFSEIKEMGGRRVPTVMVFKPQKEGEHTRMVYKSLEFDTKIDAAMFTQQGLRRVARTR